MTATDLTLARRWHALSDHAADGTSFGGGLCNCEQQSVKVALLISEHDERRNAAITAVVADRHVRASLASMGLGTTFSVDRALADLRERLLATGTVVDSRPNTGAIEASPMPAWCTPCDEAHPSCIGPPPSGGRR